MCPGGASASAPSRGTPKPKRAARRRFSSSSSSFFFSSRGDESTDGRRAVGKLSQGVLAPDPMIRVASFSSTPAFWIVASGASACFSCSVARSVSRVASFSSGIVPKSRIVACASISLICGFDTLLILVAW